MGDAADLAIEAMERGSSLVYDHKEKKTFEVDNVVLMYTSAYSDTTRFEIRGPAGDEDETLEEQYESEALTSAWDRDSEKYTEEYVEWLKRKIEKLYSEIEQIGEEL